VEQLDGQARIAIDGHLLTVPGVRPAAARRWQALWTPVNACGGD
jgi:hypothetical protein